MGGALRVRETGFIPQHHVFALPDDSELGEPLNSVILRRIEEKAWKDLVRRYIH